MNSVIFRVCQSPLGDELADEKDLLEPTRRLTPEDLAKLVKDSNEVHTKPTIKMLAVKLGSSV